MSKKTYVALVVDTSGSMASIENQAIRYYNEQVQQLKEDSADQEILVSLITFNGNVWERFWNQPASSLEEAAENSMNPNGSTAWYDALNYVIDHYKETVEAGPEDAFLIISISDGEDMCSKTKSIIRQKVKECEATKQWTFTYLGCSEENLAEIAKNTGISVQNMAAFSAGSEKSFLQAASAVNRNSRSYFSARSRGLTSCDSFYSQDGQSANFMDKAAEAVVPEVTVCNDPVLNPLPATHGSDPAIWRSPFYGDPSAAPQSFVVPAVATTGWLNTAAATGNASLDTNKSSMAGSIGPKKRSAPIRSTAASSGTRSKATGVFAAGRRVT